MLWLFLFVALLQHQVHCSEGAKRRIDDDDYSSEDLSEEGQSSESNSNEDLDTEELQEPIGPKSKVLRLRSKVQSPKSKNVHKKKPTTIKTTHHQHKKLSGEHGGWLAFLDPLPPKWETGKLKVVGSNYSIPPAPTTHIPSFTPDKIGFIPALIANEEIKNKLPTPNKHTTKSPVGKFSNDAQACIDSSPLCLFWSVKINECAEPTNCSATCGKCAAPKFIRMDDCSDNHTDCVGWASILECENNPFYMLWKCPRACRWCSAPGIMPMPNFGPGLNAAIARIKLGNMTFSRGRPTNGTIAMTNRTLFGDAKMSGLNMSAPIPPG